MNSSRRACKRPPGMYVDPHPDCGENEGETARTAVVPVAAAGVSAGAYLATYGVERYLEYAEMLGPRGETLQFGVVFALIGAHVAGHAAAFAIVGSSWRDVTLDATVLPDGSIEPVSVSVRPSEPIRRWRYSIGLAVPGVALGLLPATLGVVTGNPLSLFVGVVGLLVTGPDVQELLDAWRGQATAADRAAPSGQ